MKQKNAADVLNDLVQFLTKNKQIFNNIRWIADYSQLNQNMKNKIKNFIDALKIYSSELSKYKDKDIEKVKATLDIWAYELEILLNNPEEFFIYQYDNEFKQKDINEEIKFIKEVSENIKLKYNKNENNIMARTKKKKVQVKKEKKVQSNVGNETYNIIVLHIEGVDLKSQMKQIEKKIISIIAEHTNKEIASINYKLQSKNNIDAGEIIIEVPLKRPEALRIKEDLYNKLKNVMIYRIDLK